MTNRPKNIGTAAETAVVRAARRLGFPNADRLTLTGALDRGDVGLCPGIVLEVKGGAAAKDASDGQIDAWLRETERERTNAHAAHAFLVTQRRGVGPTNADRWWAWWRLGWIAGGVVDSAPYNTPIRMTLGDSFGIIRSIGYGEPLDPTAASDATLARLREQLTAHDVNVSAQSGGSRAHVDGAA